jgi:dolichol-phosphate mannosyltransferase
MNRPKIIIGLPAYNEALNIGALLDNLENTLGLILGFGFERLYVVVDDGSADQTKNILREYASRIPLIILLHEQNQGLGPTIRDALRRATDEACVGDIIITMDADNTQPPGLIPLMVQKILEGHDVVIASRFREGARVIGLRRVRKCTSIGASLMMRIIFPMKGVRDYTCGFRAYRAELLRRAFGEYGEAFIDQRGFQCMSDILIKLRRFNPIAGEVPMILRYDYKKGSSSMKVGRTVINTLRLVLARRFGFIESGRPTSQNRS